MRDLQWTEKYRPVTAEGLSLPADVRGLLGGLLQGNGSLPNLLLYGPPGSGKTSLALILSRGLTSRENTLELNASSDREISVIRGKLKQFAMTRAHSGEMKVVIMDECEYLTVDAQHCLRRILEDTQRNTRFIFITNYVNRVIDPIKSRLVAVAVPAASKEECLRVLQDIKEKEGLGLAVKDLEYIIEVSGGDMRRAITLLQTVGMARVETGSYRALIRELAGVVPSEMVDHAFQVRNVKDIIAVTEQLERSGYSALSLVQAFAQRALLLPEKRREVLELFQSLAGLEENIIRGGFDWIQIAAALAQVAQMNAALL
ncbi:replication factor C subunit 2/4 [Nematocida homosporus]|uniref:replication factor C subunit 2/4 n=1 Tax=Nematocida homosporus TaxID=1912981 RepID=UPI0022204B71|nr:replication factor C subunit 2/4 [Nematocida homosporus]KAI5184370.1 replication factor C subunit 2/4 [Nematocida homosporus]